jgi:hypothetical protein
VSGDAASQNPAPAPGTAERFDIFPTPVWQVPAPAMAAFHDEIKGLLKNLWDQGYFEAHNSGYGYQTREEIFTPANLERMEWVRVLRDQFVSACNGILRERHGHSKALPFDVYCVQGWVLIQTSEQWVDGPWHHHHPATLSGCYYVQTPVTREPWEGLLMFQRPEPASVFNEQQAGVRPREGHLTIFPSYLLHRPMPTPSARDWRIAICMDAFVHWNKRFEDSLSEYPSREAYDRAASASLRSG